MIDVEQFRVHVVRPTLKYIGLYSEDAENLLVGTAVQESHLTYLKQHGSGPAVGVYQMEPTTHDDIWDNYLSYKSKLGHKLLTLSMGRKLEEGDEASTEMAGNLYYATAMARIHYLRVKEPLPAANDIAGMARYYKKYYNTELGKGTEEQFIENYNRYVK